MLKSWEHAYPDKVEMKMLGPDWFVISKLCYSSKTFNSYNIQSMKCYMIRHFTKRYRGTGKLGVRDFEKACGESLSVIGVGAFIPRWRLALAQL